MSCCPDDVRSLRDLELRLTNVGAPCQLLDWAILQALGWTRFWSGQTIYVPPGEHEENCPNATINPPRPTHSIDDALTLVPEGWFWFLGHLDQSDRRFVATVEKRAVVGAPFSRGVTPTAPLSVCLAAIRARISTVAQATIAQQDGTDTDTTQASAVATGISPTKKE